MIPMFVTFEGPEGAGKSTALKFVADSLTADGKRVLCTREPGAGSFGKRVRAILLDEDAVTAETELMLFLADRANHVANVIRPALVDSQIVLCDRYIDSTQVYQGHGRGLDAQFLREANRFATRGLVPNLTLLFDLDPSVGLERIAVALGGRDNNRIDREPLAFHEKIRAGFLELASAEPNRFEILDASLPADQLGQATLEKVQSALNR
jgi:dTMP kinase